MFNLPSGRSLVSIAGRALGLPAIGRLTITGVVFFVAGIINTGQQGETVSERRQDPRDEILGGSIGLRFEIGSTVKEVLELAGEVAASLELVNGGLVFHFGEVWFTG